MQDKGEAKNFAHEKGTKAPEGAATGTTTGVLGWLAGAGALAGAGIGGAVGGLAGALIGMGMPEYEAKRYESTIKDGGMLLSVHVDNREWKLKAKDILESCGARDVSTMGEESSDLNSRSEQDERPFRSDRDIYRDDSVGDETRY